jgi:hypothetical protein
MTKFILHRANTIKQARSLTSDYGAEIDVRLNHGELILAHDPFQDGCNFFDWLNEFSGTLLAVNVKEMGLEDIIIDAITKLKPELEYFFLDQSIPYLLSSVNKGHKCAARVSEYESTESAILLNTAWLWIDSFTGGWDHLASIHLIEDVLHGNKKLCIVSPELQGRSIENTKEIKICVKKFGQLDLTIDAVCTKFPDIWRKALQ